MALQSTRELVNNKFSTKKEPKKNNSTKVHMSISTNGRVAQKNHKSIGTNDTKGNGSQHSPEDLRQRRKDVEIDEYLFSLIKDEMIDAGWRRWHAKAIYTLGLEEYNVIILDVRDAIVAGREGRAKPVASPIGLVSWKVKGALNLKARRKFYDERTS